MGNHITHSDTAVIKKTILRDQRATAHFAAKLNMTQGPIRAPLRLLGIGPFVPLQVIRRRSTNHQDNVCSSVCSQKNHQKTMFYLMISILLPFCGGIFEGPGTLAMIIPYLQKNRPKIACTTGGKALCWASSPTPFRCKGWGLLSEYVSADLYVNYHPEDPWCCYIWKHGSHQYTPNVSKYTIHGSYGSWCKNV